jgi:protocatechuate 3,4-dioxygenase beta subunit
MTLLGLGSIFETEMAEAATAVVLTPQAEEGPYFVDEKLNRSDVIVDPFDNSITEGLPLMLGITVSQSVDGVVSPLPNAYVDIWQANADGVYSDEAVQGTTGRKYLRGYQVTDAHGNVHFLTIYPGWYRGRTAHIHCRVRLYSGTTATYSFETQFFFDEAITDRVYNSVAPYTTRAAQRDTTNAADGIYNLVDCTTGAVSGNELTLVLNANTTRAVASYSLILDLSAAGPEGCIGVTNGGINEGSRGGGTPPAGGGGTPPTGGTPPGGGPPPSGGIPFGIL